MAYLLYLNDFFTYSHYSRDAIASRNYDNVNANNTFSKLLFVN